MKSIGPVAMYARMLASKPANHVTVDQIKSKKGTAEEAGARAIDRSRLSWGRSTGPEARDGGRGSMHALKGVPKKERARLLAPATFT